MWINWKHWNSFLFLWWLLIVDVFFKRVKRVRKVLFWCLELVHWHKYGGIIGVENWKWKIVFKNLEELQALSKLYYKVRLVGLQVVIILKIHYDLVLINKTGQILGFSWMEIFVLDNFVKRLLLDSSDVFNQSIDRFHDKAERSNRDHKRK